MSEQSKGNLTKIEATVMKQTAESLELLMQQTDMTMGEAIDRMALHLRPENPEMASTIALEEILYIFSYLDEKGFFEAVYRVVLALGGCLSDEILEALVNEAKANRSQAEQKFREMTDEEKAQQMAEFKAIIQKIYEKDN